MTAALHSADSSVDAAAMGINAVSAALMSSGVPWYGPVGAVRMAMVDSEILVSPSAEQAAAAEWTMLFVGGKHGVVLIDMQVQPLLRQSLSGLSDQCKSGVERLLHAVSSFQKPHRSH